MSIMVILGTQWGDEGKGRVVDMLAADAVAVARFNGGDNAGHTVTIGPSIFRLHLLPSGVLNPGVVGVIGSGVVVNPRVLLKEIDELAAHGIAIGPDRLKLSHIAQLILPSHIAFDIAHETQEERAPIGTTRRGIGPAYADKASRTGIRAGEMAARDDFAEQLRQELRRANQVLERAYGQAGLDIETAVAEYSGYARRLAPYLADTRAYLYSILNAGEPVIAEGAQGVLLDIDHGTYPYVTSSPTSIGGVFTGLGIGPQFVDRIVGVTKAFQTRVGGGPFPTELQGDLATRLRGTGANPWDEYGTTTGRPRRVGWLDGVALRYAVEVNGITELVVTKLDVLSGLASLRIAVAYERGGQRLESFPADARVLAECRPIYEEMSGWAETLSSVRETSDLPAAARVYLSRISDLAGASITMVSVGPEREQIVR